MGHTNTHDIWTDRLSDYADGELSPAEQAEVDAHLAACGECRAIAGELRRVAAQARSLADAPPDRDLWQGIAARIGAASPGDRGASRRFSFTLPQLIAASLALMVLSGGGVWLARLGGERTDFPAITADSRVMPASFADTHYDDAIADLQQTLDAGRSKLDAQTVRVLEESLASIDRAIEQCRRALAEDPANAYLSDHLVAAKKKKLALLRRATAMADGAS